MIVKVKGYFENEFYLFSDVSAVSYWWVSKEYRQRKRYNPDFYFQETTPKGKLNEDNENYFEIKLEFNDFRKKPIIICSNLPVYIYSESGNLVDKINV